MNKIKPKLLFSSKSVNNCYHYYCCRRSASSAESLPSEAKVLIYGSDLTTASVAYQLSVHQNYGNNCVVITGNKADANSMATPITTAATNSCPLSHVNVTNPRVTHLIHFSKQLFDVNTCGSLYLARNQWTVDSFKRRMSSAKLVLNPQNNSQSIDFLTADELHQRYGHYLNCEGVLGALYVPNDGIIEDIDGQRRRLETMAANNGIKFLDNLLLNKININNNNVSNVELIDSKTNRIKRIECQYFINTSNNYYTRLIAKRSPTRVRIPTLCVHNQVLVTKPFNEFDLAESDGSTGSQIPILHDFDKCFTVYQTTDRTVCLSGYEKVSKILQKKMSENDRTGAINVEIPEIPLNWDDFHNIMSPILDTIPVLSGAKLHRLVSRLENFTPDGRSLIGEVAEVGNYLLAAAVAPQLAAGAGCLITDIVTKSEKTFDHDFWSLDPRRFIASQSNRIYLFDRLREVPSKARYNINFPTPHNDYQTGHGLRISPLHEQFKDAGAMFTQIMGYERPAVYMYSEQADSQASDTDSGVGESQRHRHLTTHTFGRPHWLDAVHAEYQACRERVALLDYCSFTKLELRSPNEEVVDLLQYLCSNDVDVNIGTIVHTGMQNERGGYENDVSLFRLADNHYMLIGPSEQHSRCISWIKGHNFEPSIEIKDISGLYTGLCVMGPLSKLVLQEVLAEPSQLDTFPFFTFKELAIGLASKVRVCNLTHTGELGWVLYIPNEYAVHVHDLLVRVGQKYGMKHAGSIAMRTLRIEKFFAFWGQDLDTTTTPFECGRSFRVKFDKDFLGRNALVRQKAEGVRRRYVQLLLDDFEGYESIWPWGGEPIFICDSNYDSEVPVGLTTTTGYGFTLGRHVCLGFIRHPENQIISNEFILKSKFEVEIGAKRFRARINIHSPKLTDVSGTYLATR